MAKLSSTTVYGDHTVTGSLKIKEGKLCINNEAVTATAAELNRVGGVTSSIQTQLNGKAASSHTHGSLTNDGKVGTTTNQVVVTGTGGAITTASRSGIDSRANFPPSTHDHNYAGSSSAGGAANSTKTAVTFNNGGSGAGSGTTFNGSTARTISYNTIGAAASGHKHSYLPLAGGTLTGNLKGTTANFSGEVKASSFNASSLRSLKNDIEPFSKNALDIINTVDVASFTYKDDEEKNYHVGFIADDTHEILAGKNHDHMDIGNSVGVLIKAVQELNEKIRNLEEENIKLKEKIYG